MVTGYSFYFGVLLPVALSLVVNICVLVVVLKTLIRSFKNKAKMTQSEKPLIFTQAKITLACSCLLGITWIFGLFAVGELTETFQWLFTIFNSLQGLFIFIFYTLTNQDVKKEWLKYVYGEKHGNNPTAHSSGPSSSGKKESQCGELPFMSTISSEIHKYSYELG